MITINIFNIPIKIPAALGKYLVWGIVVITVTGLLLLPELRQISRQKLVLLLNLTTPFPEGCTSTKVQLAEDAPDVRAMRVLIMRPVTELDECNPASVRRSEKSSVFDIAHFGDSQEVSTVAVDVRNRSAVIGLKDDKRGGKITAILCESPPSAYAAEWGSFVNDMITLQPVQSPSIEFLQGMCEEHGFNVRR